MIVHFILYVRDQQRSCEFYRAILGIDPFLNVEGISEFQLTPTCILGVMPTTGIQQIIGDELIDPVKAEGVAKGEVYLQVEDPEGYGSRTIESGGKLLSPLQRRNWGEDVSYYSDLDGNVIAFARQGEAN